MNIKNFSIIAHVDHGKSTLADRLLEITGTVVGNKMQPQLLDSLALERERGITIKLAPVRMSYKSSVIASTSMSLRAERSNLSVNSAKQSDDEIASSSFDKLRTPRNDEKEYTLNLIDTPGHVDFSYEVSRSLAAVEGAILLVDATSGIQAQTLSHGLSALEQNLTLIPVVNKIDLPNANVENCKKQLSETFGFLENEILLVSGKTGKGVKELLEEIIKRVPSPKINDEKPLRALIFDSFFDTYKGVVAGVRIVDGEVPKVGTKIKFLGTGAIGEVLEKGYFSPGLTPVEDLKSGEIGYIATAATKAEKIILKAGIKRLNLSNPPTFLFKK